MEQEDELVSCIVYVIASSVLTSSLHRYFFAATNYFLYGKFSRSGLSFFGAHPFVRAP